MPKRKYWRKSAVKKQPGPGRSRADDQLTSVDNPGLGGSSEAKHPVSCDISVDSDRYNKILLPCDSILCESTLSNLHSSNLFINEPSIRHSSNLFISEPSISNLYSKECHVPQSSAQIQSNSSILPTDPFLLQSKTIQTQKSNCQKLEWESYTIGHVIQASIHQGSPVFHASSRGKQCTCNALVYLCVSQDKHSLTSEDLNCILHNGDSLYRETVSYLQASNKFYSGILKFDELPNVMHMKSLQYNVERRKQYFGLLNHFTAVDVPDCLQFKYAVPETFNSSNTLLLMTGGYCMALSKHHSGKYCIFDSHSRNSNGLQHIDGSSILMFFDTQHALINYLFSLFDNLGLNKMTAYELQEVVIHAKHSARQVQQQHDRHEELMVNYFNFQTRLSSKKNTQRLDSYEGNMNSTVSSVPKKVSSKQHAREYKQKRRQNHTILAIERQKDKLRKALKRQNREFKEREKLKLRSHITELRQNPEFKERKKIKLRSHITELRQNSEFKDREKIKLRSHITALRQNPEFKDREKSKLRSHIIKLRQNPEFKEREKAKLRSHITKLRQNPEFKDREKMKLRSRLTKLRQNPVFKEREKRKLQSYITELRQNPEFKEKEKLKLRSHMKNLRQNPNFRQLEKDRLKINIQNLRKNSTFRLKPLPKIISTANLP
ncbi:uncharacterized protein [Ptychodera flava]|uniref:uncharacterized protein isoform X2 n=1 Tax=Ptychodera flava TaxID=63121 RepID=UPI003969FBA4